jgi:CRP-like cAMP-binding protein
MLYEKCSFKVKKLGKNDNFGAIEFFSGRSRMISAKSLEFSTVFVLTRKVFTEKLQEYPLDKVKSDCLSKILGELSANLRQYKHLWDLQISRHSLSCLREA